MHRNFSPKGYVYILHLERKMGRQQSAEERKAHGHGPRKEPYTAHAQHYAGHADDLRRRIRQHVTGSGSAFTRQAVERGIEMRVARVWTGGYELEKELKSRKATPRYCPCCQPSPYSLAGAEDLSTEELSALLGDLYDHI